MDSAGSVFVGKRIIFIFRDNKIEKSPKANKILHSYAEADLKSGLENAFRIVMTKQKKKNNPSLRKTTSFSSMRWIHHTCRSSDTNESIGSSEPSSPNEPLFKSQVNVIHKDEKTVWVKIVLVVDEINSENRSTVSEKVMFCKAVSYFYKRIGAVSENTNVAVGTGPSLVTESFVY